jgi:S-adenosylhomocysteine hydrolase
VRPGRGSARRAVGAGVEVEVLQGDPHRGLLAAADLVAAADLQEVQVSESTRPTSQTCTTAWWHQTAAISPPGLLLATTAAMT